MLQKTIFKQGKKAVYKMHSSGSCKEKSMFGNITSEEDLRSYIIISKCVEFDFQLDTFLVHCLNNHYFGKWIWLYTYNQDREIFVSLLLNTHKEISTKFSYKLILWIRHNRTLIKKTEMQTTNLHQLVLELYHNIMLY